VDIFLPWAGKLKVRVLKVKKVNTMALALLTIFSGFDIFFRLIELFPKLG
jgi:hypothetical protein